MQLYLEECLIVKMVKTAIGAKSGVVAREALAIFEIFWKKVEIQIDALMPMLRSALLEGKSWRHRWRCQFAKIVQILASRSCACGSVEPLRWFDINPC